MAVIGAGTFGRGVVAQAMRAPGLRVTAVVDRDLDAAGTVFRTAGVADSEVVVCDSGSEARQAIASGRRVVTGDAETLLDETTVDVVVEATGSAEAGARHARAAIAAGTHVAMVTKEADAAVGPILRHLADRAGIAYLPVDGDQHGLLIGLVAWARSIGLEILCGGKALDGELVVHRPGSPDASLTHGAHAVPVAAADLTCFAPVPPGGDLRGAVAARAAALGTAGGARPWDLTELTIAANASGLVPDRPGLHCPAVWTSEIPAALCPKEFGGLLTDAGTINAVQVLRQPHEAGLAGGVFLVVRAPNGSGRHLFPAEAVTPDPDVRTALVTHPLHLLGTEAVSTILAAGLMGRDAGAFFEYQHHFNLVYRALSPLRTGDRIGGDHSLDLAAEIVAATPLSATSTVPAGLATGRPLRHDLAAGALVTADAVRPPANSVLWRLRAEQDAHFLAHKG